MTLSTSEKSEVRRQVGELLGKNDAFRHLGAAQRASILEDTSRVVEAMAAGGSQALADPYAMPMAVDRAGRDRVGAKLIRDATKDQLKVGDVIGAGVTQAARMVKEIDFPKFVSSLIDGVFKAIVKSSMEQMKAYADMVKSVSGSLNDFKDKNTTDNEARDMLAARYPRHIHVTIVNGQPTLAPKDSMDDLPDFARDFGLTDRVSDLDEETLEGKLLPAMRDQIALGRQQLLATIILMGINRIVVTDGRINAKIKFQFSATESRSITAKATDYDYMGEKVTTEEDRHEAGPSTNSGYFLSSYRTTGEGYINELTRKDTREPDVRVSSDVDMTSDASINASGQIMGEVALNFKSETFPLEKMVDTAQLMQLQRAQSNVAVPGAGRGAPPPGAAAAAPANAPAAAPIAAPAPAPAVAPAAR